MGRQADRPPSVGYLRPSPSLETRVTHTATIADLPLIIPDRLRSGERAALPARPPGPAPLALRVGIALAVLSVATLVLAGPGSRLGWWSARAGYDLLRLGSFGALGGALATAAGLALDRGRHRAATAVGAAAALLAAAALAARLLR